MYVIPSHPLDVGEGRGITYTDIYISHVHVRAGEGRQHHRPRGGVTARMYAAGAGWGLGHASTRAAGACRAGSLMPGVCLA